MASKAGMLARCTAIREYLSSSAISLAPVMRRSLENELAGLQVKIADADEMERRLDAQKRLRDF